MFNRIAMALCLSIWASIAFGAGITITSPHGGEFYLVGQTQFVRLADNTRFKSIRIELSRDAGITWSSLGVIDNTVSVDNRNVLQFPVTGPSAPNCVIRATAIPPGKTGTSTTGAFAILDGLPPTGAVGLAGGDLTGMYPSPTIAANAVTTMKVADLAVTAKKVNSEAASGNFILAADGLGGANWVPALNTIPTNFGAQNIQTTGTVAASSVIGNVMGDLTGNVTGNVNGSAVAFTGQLVGDVIGTQSATVVSTVGGTTAASIASGANLANAGTAANTPNAIVKRDGSGNFSGNATNVTGIVKIINGGTGSATQNFVDVSSNQAAIGGNKTFAGTVTLSGDPTVNLQAATKQYVDSEKSRAQAAEGTLTTNLSNEAIRATAAEGLKVSKAGDTMMGALTLSGDPTLSLHAATKQYVDAETNGTYLRNEKTR